MLDLFNNQYDLITLKKNIYALNLIDIIKTQQLDADFVLKYILNKNFQLTKEEEDITITDILKWQPHLLNTNLLVDHLSGIKKVDSWNEFEVVGKISF
jgi:hypothetical protein